MTNLVFSNKEYPTYQEREDMKRMASQEYNKTDDTNLKAQIIVHGTIKSYYWRARGAIEDLPKSKTKLKKIRGKGYYPGYVLDIDHYTENWLYSMGDNYEPEVIKAIEDIFGYKAKANKFMEKGYTYYIFDGEV